MNQLEKVTLALANASNGNPVISTATVMLFFVMFNILEARIEKLLFGERFEHWLDPVFMLVFIAYSAYAVWWCAVFNGALYSMAAKECNNVKENHSKTIPRNHSKKPFGSGL